MPSTASIVIPAHNEEGRIRSLLTTLSDPSIAGLYDVYVVCNGCVDNTRQVAEEYAGITVVEIEDAGKYYALNEGDRLAGDVFPRLYCDADIQISPASIAALVSALTTEDVRAAGPTIRYGVENTTSWVKLYFRSHQTQIIGSWLNEHLTGRGLYGLSRAARERFQTFPSLLADDLFFDSQFTPEEKVVVPEAVVTIWVPKNLRELIRAEVRVTGGNQQFHVAESENTAPIDPLLVPSSHFELRLHDRIEALRTWKRDLGRGEGVPLLMYVFVVISAKTILNLRRLRGLQVRWR